MGTNNPFPTNDAAKVFIKGKFQAIFLENMNNWYNQVNDIGKANLLTKFNLDPEFDDITDLINKINNPSFDPDIFSFIKVR